MRSFGRWTAVGLALGACPAEAYVIEQNTALAFQAGGFCNYPPDNRVAAPQTHDGAVQIHNQPYHFVVKGDEVPVLPDLAIGVVVQLKSFTPGETLTIRQFRFEDMRAPDT